MAKYLVQDTSLTAVADAIRTKGDTSGSLVFPGDFVSAIEGISSGHSLAVLVPINSSVTIGKNGETYTNIADSNGVTIFSNLSKGTWSVTVSDGTISKTETVEITEDCTVKIVLSTIPSFTYDGDYEIVNDDDNEITSSADNWKIRFLTSGTLTFTALNGAEDGIDVFYVGGGAGGAYKTSTWVVGGGGGGGYTATYKNVAVSAGYAYDIVIGSGGGGNASGGSTSAFGHTVSGGYSGTYKDTSPINGGNGGSGGGCGWDGAGGTNGSDGEAVSGSTSGKGQISTPGPHGETGNTCEFGEEGATVYSNGGASANATQVIRQDENTGHGGDGDGTQGSATAYGYGSSGIVIIRNAR